MLSRSRYWLKMMDERFPRKERKGECALETPLRIQLRRGHDRDRDWKKEDSSFTLVSHHNEPKVRTMNNQLLYQWEETIAEAMPIMNSWQVANMALFSYGVIRAESCQQSEVARQVACGERVDSAARRWRRFLDNTSFPLAGFFQAWSSWVVEALAGAGDNAARG